jgi:MFS family permease
VNLGLAVGLVGGGMVVPLGSVFSIEVLGAGAAGYGVFITALGFGVAIGVVLISVTQTRLPKPQIFILSLLIAGGSLLLAACMSSLTTAVLCVGVLGVSAGSVYVLGFTLLQENTSDELRGRIFSALYSLVRLCLILAFAVGPFLSDLLNRIVAARLSDCTKRKLCTAHFPGGFHVDLPGVRVTLWLAGLIVLGGGMLAALSLRRGMAEQESAAADRAPADAAGAGA